MFRYKIIYEDLNSCNPVSIIIEIPDRIPRNIADLTIDTQQKYFDKYINDFYRLKSSVILISDSERLKQKLIIVSATDEEEINYFLSNGFNFFKFHNDSCILTKSPTL